MDFPNNKNCIEDVLDYLRAKYKLFDRDEAYVILDSFIRLCKSEILAGREIRINRIGTFLSRRRLSRKSKTIYKKERIIPEMNVPIFKSASTFRKYLNGE